MQLETMAEKELRRGGPVLAESRRFLVKLAENAAELEQAFRLRYDVFKLEQGRMASLASRIDRDEFDDYCSHLLVVDRDSAGRDRIVELGSGIVPRDAGRMGVLVK